ncbi:MAG: tRNA-specific 2-thiouridylase [Planctomycetota bacterium]|jgi:tRNA-specific 2-thiouridylase
MTSAPQKIFVGLSGGVDSSVVAALLQDAGFQVVGVFIRSWQPEWSICTWREDRRSAMAVAAHLGIPFLECDLSKEYKRYVADYMIEEYRKGRTPNPDIMCNREIKFGAFLGWALDRGASKIATGHYAQIVEGATGLSLARGSDSTKDQSYFLWTLTKAQLANAMFPLGGMEKSRVRSLAKKYSLPTASRPDSQGVCMLGDISMKDFLREYIDESPGEVINSDGEVIGRHEGVLFYTLGERHGFIIEVGDRSQPHYVIEKDIEKNILVVSAESSAPSVVEQRIYTLEQVIDRSGLLRESYRGHIQIRHLGELYPCTVRDRDEEGQKLTLVCDSDTLLLASGQSVVFYEDTTCIGGGILQ